MRGRRRLVAGAAAAALAAAGYAFAADVAVTLGGAGPQPAVATADWGDTLSFVNGDSVTHAITSPRDDLRADTIAPGGTYTSVVTARAGSYQYRQTGGKTFTGTVVVQASGTVSLKALAPSLLFGRPARLTGVSTKPDTPVLIEERLTGDPDWHTAVSTSSAADGAFGVTVPLARSAKLRASIDGGQVRSGAVAVAVSPLLTLSSPARRTTTGHVVAVRAHLTPAGAATQVTLAQCNAAAGGGWRAFATRRPGAGGGVVFRWRALAGRTALRAEVRRADAAQGFGARTSAVLAVTGSGASPSSKKHRAPHPC